MIAAKQEKVLVFTQFREMTAPLAAFLGSVFGRPGLVLHGETAVGKRQALVRQFQEDERVPFFVLSLKAGGAGLNLTAASHVVHFDRWWNPAVENQATDRAFRIGQTKNVLVHKFVCRGTVEERIDQLIDSKRQLSAGSARRRRRDAVDRDERRRAPEARRARSPHRVRGVRMALRRLLRLQADYVSVGARRAQAARELAKLQKKGRKISPVVIEGRTIADDVLGRGVVRQPRTLQRLRESAAARPDLRAQRIGGRSAGRAGQRHGARQRLDDVRREGDGRDRWRQPRWSAICKDCSGAIDSLVELLQGRFSKGVMTRLCEEKTGLFPSPKDILFTCSCPDWASMCKHVAAVLYGIGARLDHQPELLFTLRKVDQQDLIAKAGSDLSKKRKRPAGAKVLASDDLSEMFGIEMAPPTPAKRPAASAVPRKPSPASQGCRVVQTEGADSSGEVDEDCVDTEAGDEERRLTPKKRRAIAERMRKYWAERIADATRRKTSGSL